MARTAGFMGISLAVGVLGGACGWPRLTRNSTTVVLLRRPLVGVAQNGDRRIVIACGNMHFCSDPSRASRLTFAFAPT